MRILDRERYWAFLKAYIICFIALVGLYVVIHAFTNLDEFTERSDGIVQLFQVMGQYYAIRLSLFYDPLCGIISMRAAMTTANARCRFTAITTPTASSSPASRPTGPRGPSSTSTRPCPSRSWAS